MATPPTVVAGNVIEVAWGNAVRDWAALGEVDNSGEVAGPVGLTTVAANIVSVSLTIPAAWLSWSCFAYASYMIQNDAGVDRTYLMVIRIDGTDQQEKSVFSETATVFDGSVGGRRTGMVTTGSRTVELRGRQGVGTGMNLSDVFLYARAKRVT